MKIAILAAMDKELNLMLALLENKSEVQSNGLTIYKGSVGSHTIAMTKCGIGKVNAALNTSKIIEAFSPELVINSGVAGGAGIPIGSILIADRVAYDDVWCGPGTKYGQADGFPMFMLPSQRVLDALEPQKSADMVRGLICTGDRFISTAEEIAFIRSKFPDVCAVDMESAAIAQVCMSYHTEFAILRVVSDTPGEGENIEQYKNFWSQAPEKTFETIHSLISSL